MDKRILRCGVSAQEGSFPIIFVDGIASRPRLDLKLQTVVVVEMGGRNFPSGLVVDGIMDGIMRMVYRIHAKTSINGGKNNLNHSMGSSLPFSVTVLYFLLFRHNHTRRHSTMNATVRRMRPPAAHPTIRPILTGESVALEPVGVAVVPPAMDTKRELSAGAGPQYTCTAGVLTYSERKMCCWRK